MFLKKSTEMIKLKKKPCKYHIGKLCYLFSHGMCKEGYAKTYSKSITRSPLVPHPKKNIVQDGKILSEKEAFKRAYVNRGGVWFLTGEKVPLEQLTASNFAHLLPKAKNKFPYFKYYWKNILILEEDDHYVLDNGTEEQVSNYIGELTAYEAHRWGSMMNLKDELILEYAEWTFTNPGEYKL